VFGPNNFPYAYNGAAGGDFAAAIAAGNPVIAKSNSSHPGTTKRLAELAFQAVQAAELPLATVQLIYRTSHEHGERLVSDPRNGAVGYTGARAAGLKLKAAADLAGKPIYLELSSVNPVVLLPGALAEKCDDLVNQFTASCLMGAGQFCTNPGLIVLIAGEATNRFIAQVAEKFRAAAPGTLLSRGVFASLGKSIDILMAAGAKRLTGDQPADESRYCRANTLLHVSGAKFLADPHLFQTEAFGNSSLLVEAADLNEAVSILESLEGNLTGSIYGSTDATDDAAYAATAAALRPRVGRLLNDKMPTGVAVSAAMNHGGPFPATGHPAFTAVGVPASLKRFVMLECFDNVREHRLPPLLRNRNPSGAWRYIDGRYTQDDIS
jgi:NADP-dependent aldehyde dehydrogenase